MAVGSLEDHDYKYKTVVTSNSTFNMLRSLASLVPYGYSVIVCSSRGWVTKRQVD